MLTLILGLHDTTCCSTGCQTGVTIKRLHRVNGVSQCIKHCWLIG